MGGVIMEGKRFKGEREWQGQSQGEEIKRYRTKLRTSQNVRRINTVTQEVEPRSLLETIECAFLFFLVYCVHPLFQICPCSFGFSSGISFFFDSLE